MSELMSKFCSGIIICVCCGGILYAKCSGGLWLAGAAIGLFWGGSKIAFAVSFMADAVDEGQEK